ncbi:MAG: sugar phosphate isomerase/epimerase [Phycisphaerales bacterium]|nr:sugar phosphate isomerase/epimerase [Phycisphaerales bacterium]
MTPSNTKSLAVCSWSLKPKSPADLVEKVCNTGLSRVQLALKPLVLEPQVWSDVPRQLARAGIGIASGMFSTIGEDYRTLESIKRTGGLIPDETWEENWSWLQKMALWAGQLQLKIVSGHIGFIPHDLAAPHAIKLLDRTAQLAKLFAAQGCLMLMETGQESADTLIRFLQAFDRRNVKLGVNFDPANMILYGKGDPVDALARLMPWVRQVHIKDAVSSSQPGLQWGSEVAVGEGAVNWQAFTRVLREGCFAGDLVIEREHGDNRVMDIRKAVEFISSLQK